MLIRFSALRAMISEFVFFICIAATCFSGLLLTLYALGKSPCLMYFPHTEGSKHRISGLSKA